MSLRQMLDDRIGQSTGDGFDLSIVGRVFERLNHHRKSICPIDCCGIGRNPFPGKLVV
jgi:hypothetical protein